MGWFQFYELRICFLCCHCGSTDEGKGKRQRTVEDEDIKSRKSDRKEKSKDKKRSHKHHSDKGIYPYESEACTSAFQSIRLFGPRIVFNLNKLKMFFF